MYHHLMSFRWGTDVGEFLFPGLYVNGLIPLILLCIILVCLSLAYEGFKVMQTQSKARTARERLQTASLSASETSNLIINKPKNRQHDISTSAQAIKFIGQLSAFLVHNTIGYMLMLSVMVYNAYVFIAVVAGMGLGYFLFGHIAMKINMENIRARTTKEMFSIKPSGGASTSGLGNFSSLQYSSNSSSSSSSLVNNVGPSFNPTVHNQTNVEMHPQIQSDESNVLHSCRL